MIKMIKGGSAVDTETRYDLSSDIGIRRKERYEPKVHGCVRFAKREFISPTLIGNRIRQLFVVIAWAS